jgi:hypothetical protein
VLHPAAEQLYLQMRQWQLPAAQSATTALAEQSMPEISQALLHLTQDIVMSGAAQPRLSSIYTTPELQQMLGMPLLLGAISLALFTVLLSGIGLIGVMQYNLQLRQNEFSIKLALGA